MLFVMGSLGISEQGYISFLYLDSTFIGRLEGEDPSVNIAGENQ